MNTSTFNIGVGGHQNLSNEAMNFVTQQFRELLAIYQQRERDLVLYSALALGADQLFVRIALDLGLPVEAVLPCAEYEANYASEETRNEYTRLLYACRAHHQLPIQKCSGDAYLAAGKWIVDQSDLTILAWNGFPSQGRGGTADMASYARSTNCPFVYINTRRFTVQTYGDVPSRTRKPLAVAPKREFTVAKEEVYHGAVLTVNRYRLQMPGGEELVRDIVERPESVLVLPVAQGKKDVIVLLIEEHDLGAGTWQLKLPGGKIEHTHPGGAYEQAQKELRQETGYRAGRLEKLLDFHSHPGYVSHKVHLFVAQDLEWDPLELETHEEIQVQTYALKDALAETLVDYRCDPEAALALLLYAQKVSKEG